MMQNFAPVAATTTMPIRPVSLEERLCWPDSPPCFCNVVHICWICNEQILQWDKSSLWCKEGVNSRSRNQRAVKSVMVAIPGSDNGKQIWKKISELHWHHQIWADLLNGFWNGLLEEGTHQDMLNGEALERLLPKRNTKLKQARDQTHKPFGTKPALSSTYWGRRA